MAERVNVVNPFGRVVSIDASKLDAALADNYRMPTAEEVTQARAERDYGGVAGMAGATAAGVARGAPLVSSDLAIEAAGGGEALRGMQAANPNLSTGAEFAGSMVGAGKFKGAGMLAKAARGVGAPVRGVMKAGAAAERALGGKVVGAAARGVIEGAAFGAGSAVSESVLADRELTGEALLASIGYGAAVGGVLGGAVSGAGRALKSGQAKLAAITSRPGQEGAEALAASAFGEAAEGVGGPLGRLWSKTAALAGVEGAENIPHLLKFRQEAARATQTIAKETDRMLPALQEMHKAIRSSADTFTGKAKAAQVARLVSRDTAEAALARSRQSLGGLQGEIDDMIAQGTGAFGKQGGKNGLKQLRKEIAHVQKRLAKETDPAKAMMMLDDVKRGVGRLTKSGTGKRWHSLRAPERATRARMDNAYENFREMLEDETVWGAAGKLQKDINAPWAGLLDTQKRTKVGRLFESFEGRFGKPIERVNEAEFRRIFANPRDPKNAEILDGLRAWAESGEAFTKAAGDNLVLSGDAKKAIGNYGRNSKAMLDALGKVDRAALLGEQLATLGRGGTEAPGVVGAIGYMAGGGSLATGGPIGLAAGAIFDPERAIRSLAGVEALSARVAKRIAKAGPRLSKGGTVGRVGAWTALEARERKKLEHSATTLANDTSDTGAFINDVHARISPAAIGSPAAADHMAQVALRGANYLAMHAPQPSARPDVLGAPKMPVSDHELEVFERRRAVVDDPLSVLDRVEDGSITPEAVDAIKNVMPALYDQMRESYIDEIIKLSEKGDSLDYDRALALEMFLEQPLVSVNHPETVGVIQEMYAETDKPKPQPNKRQRKPEVAHMHKLESEDSLDDE